MNSWKEQLRPLFGLLVAMGSVAGCDDPFSLSWASEPAIAQVYTLSNPWPNLPSAFDFVFRTPVRIEVPGATGTWDMAFDSDEVGFHVLPPGALGVLDSEAGVVRIDGLAFAEVTSAPEEDDVFILDRPVALEVGIVYVVRTREEIGFYGEPCNWYAKLQPLELDTSTGLVRFAYDVNPNCGDRALVPPN
jgi:hypothetical protein